MYDLLSCKDLCAQRSRLRDKRVVSTVFSKRRRYAPCCGTSEAVAVTSTELAKSRSAQLHRLFEYRVEHGGEIAGRGVDDPQHLGGRGLLFQGFACLGDQPRILHRDDRLCREVLEQCNLFVAERPDFLTERGDSTQESVVARKRYD